MDMKMKTINKKILCIMLFLAICLSSLFFNDQTAEAKTKIKLNTSSISIYVGNTYKLKLKNAKASKVKWSSTNSEIAKVSNGKVTALSHGKATITAKYLKHSYKCKVTVISNALSTNSLTLRLGQEYSIELQQPNNKTDWESSNTQVAEVNSNGFVIPVEVGDTIITASVGAEKYTCSVKIVKAFTEDDFVFDDPTDEGFTNYIDYSTDKGSNWYFYYNESSEKYHEKRDINVGSTYEEFTAAYGYNELSNVDSNDSYSKYFVNSAYPRTYVELDYFDSSTQIHYYKKFYFDRNGTVVLIIWHR